MLIAKTRKRLQTTQAQLQEISYCSSTTVRDFLCSSTTTRDFYSNRITKKNVWGWTLDIQSVLFTIQIRYGLL